MQLRDFFNGNDLADRAKIAFFKLLPPAAKVEKIRTEINRGLLQKYGQLTRLEIDKKNKTITADLDLKGEKEGVRITLSNYRLIQAADKNPLFKPGTIQASREWLDALLKTLAKTSIIPERIEVKNLLHQAVVKAIL